MPKKEDSKPPLRRSARVNGRVPVTISGTLPDNQTFAEETHILTISKYGAKLQSQYPLKIGMQLRVKLRDRRVSGLFKVVWTGHEGSLREGEVGIEYVQVSNLLGIAFPE